MLLCGAVLPPIAQDPRYHLFADSRTFFGIPNFWNVISNAPFLVIALYAARAHRRPDAFLFRWERAAHATLLAATAAVSFGSAYYHLRPDDGRLFWDRLPMAVVFMSLLAAVIGERLSPETGRRLLVPLLLSGAASVLYWHLSGDLRPYAVVQYGALLAVPLLLVLFPARYSGTVWTWAALGLYTLAKSAELLDGVIASAIPMGGHPLKHLLAAAALLAYLHGVATRHRLPDHPEPLLSPEELREALQ